MIIGKYICRVQVSDMIPDYKNERAMIEYYRFADRSYI